MEAIKGKHNVARRAAMQRRNDKQLAEIVKGKTLSSAAAYFELKQRGRLAVLAAR